MLTHLLKKSRPISFIIIGIGLLIIYCIDIFGDTTWSKNAYGLVTKLILFCLIVLSVLLVQFINYKNKLSRQNVFALYFYACFLVLFSTYFDNTKIIISNFLVLLALRRIFSMNSLLQLKSKIFDAALWISFATLFHFWNILFFALLYFSIIWYCSNDYRNWLIPVISASIVGFLFYVLSLYTPIDFTAFWESSVTVSFNFSYFDNVFQNIALAIFSSIALLFTAAQLLNLRNIPLSSHIIYNKILVCFLIGASIYILSENKNNSFLVFTFFPLSVLGANFVERSSNKTFKEVVLAGMLLLSLFIFVSQQL